MKRRVRKNKIIKDQNRNINEGGVNKLKYGNKNIEKLTYESSN